MPLILLNFPKIDLIDYSVVYHPSSDNLRRIKFKYNDANFLEARRKAIEKALELRTQLQKSGQWNPVYHERIKLYLLFRSSRPEQGTATNDRIYLLDGKFDLATQIQILDLETAHLLGAEKTFPQKELDCGLLTYVVVDQQIKELLNFYR